jgi:hypothetical protein
MGARSWAGLVAGVAVVGLLGGCATGSNPSPTAAPSGSAALRSDPFAGLTYRLDLPTDWMVLGSASYDATLDTAPDVADWLKRLELSGPNSFRAYEPLPAAAGMRLAINPSTTWDSLMPGPLQDGTALAALPGVTGKPIGDWVPMGVATKGGRFRWTQTLDWGNGSPSARNCVSYVALGEFDAVNVVFSYPAEKDRLAEVEAMMASFEVLGNPVVSLAPGATPTPSPTPYDKFASSSPMLPSHADPELEALLPDSIGGVALMKSSIFGEQMGLTDADPLLSRFGKHPADLASATATLSNPPLFIGVERLRGVPADQLLAVMIQALPSGNTASRTSLGGHQVTYMAAGWTPIWYYATGELLYGIAGAEQDVAKVLATLP